MTGSLQIKSGKYYAVLRINGKQKWINLNIEAKRGNRKDAEIAMAKAISAADDNPNSFEKTDFAEYMKLCLKDVKKHIDIVTYEGYKQYTEKHIIPYYKEHRRVLQEMRAADIEEYYDYKSKGGRLDGKPGGLSKKTIRSHSIPISLAFKQAMHDGIINRNPCEYARLPKMETVKNKIAFYTVEVQTNLVIVKDSTKNRSSNRVYPMLSDVREILLRLKREQEDNKKTFGNCYTDTDYVFARPDGKMFYPSYPSKLLKKGFSA